MRQGKWAASGAKPAPQLGTGTSFLYPQQLGWANDPNELGSYPFPEPPERNTARNDTHIQTAAGGAVRSCREEQSDSWSITKCKKQAAECCVTNVKGKDKRKREYWYRCIFLLMSRTLWNVYQELVTAWTQPVRLQAEDPAIPGPLPPTSQPPWTLRWCVVLL